MLWILHIKFKYLSSAFNFKHVVTLPSIGIYLSPFRLLSKSVRDWVSYKQYEFIIPNSKGCKSEISVPAWQGSHEDPSLECKLLTLVSCVSLYLWPLLIRAVIPFTRVPPSWPNYLPSPHPQISPHEIRFQHTNFTETQLFSL